MISYIIGHKNRAGLLEPNLWSLLNQTDRNFEVVIVDNSDTINWTELKQLVVNFRNRGLQIRCVRIDPTKHPMAHPPTEYGGGYNPALSQNIAVRLAKGDVVCLTSPEVINAKTNIERAHCKFADGKSRFVLGWIDERRLQDVGSLDNGISIEYMKALCQVPGHGAMCRSDVPHRPWLPINYFLGFLKKEDYEKIGGVDERFMNSIGWEDNFFAQGCALAGFPAELHTDIAGIHLWHSRGYQISRRSNEPLWNKIKNESIANPGLDWGSLSYIVEDFG